MTDWIEQEKQRPYHPAANYFPLLEGEAFEIFMADIAANDLLQPIWLHPDGSILDGRNRHRACIETDTPPRFAEYCGPTDFTSLLRFVLSMNLHRRDLDSSRKAASAVQDDELVERLKEEARNRQAELGRTHGDPSCNIAGRGETSEVLAQLFDTSSRYIYYAKRLKQEARDLYGEVWHGERTIPQAMRILKEREREAVREQNRELVENTPPLAEWDGQPVPTIVIDPPWDWGDEGDVDQFGRARPTYATMTFEELLAFPVGDKAQDNAHIYLWITNRSLPKGFALLEAWGFRYITALTWCKPSFGMGNYFRGQTEHVLFGVRGSLPLLRKDAGTWFAAPRGKEHSSKPEQFYGLVERCSPGPWMEIFQREPRPGWIGWGAEV